MEASTWQFSVLYVLAIFFFVYVILAVIRNWKKGWKVVGMELLQAPLRILLAGGALVFVLLEKKIIALLFLGILFLTVYFTSKKHKEDIKQIKKELKK